MWGHYGPSSQKLSGNFSEKTYRSWFETWTNESGGNVCTPTCYERDSVHIWKKI